jgi:hypothetical protein
MPVGDTGRHVKVGAGLIIETGLLLQVCDTLTGEAGKFRIRHVMG